MRTVNRNFSTEDGQRVPFDRSASMFVPYSGSSAFARNASNTTDRPKRKKKRVSSERPKQDEQKKVPFDDFAFDFGKEIKERAKEEAISLVDKIKNSKTVKAVVITVGILALLVGGAWVLLKGTNIVAGAYQDLYRTVTRY
ncbi:MAG: hypothetical protein SFW35_03150 [Chitinophagales bacterium]|nr:hypothetical protein [Chitinophagales bacterium]